MYHIKLRIQWVYSMHLQPEKKIGIYKKTNRIKGSLDTVGKIIYFYRITYNGYLGVINSIIFLLKLHT